MNKLLLTFFYLPFIINPQEILFTVNDPTLKMIILEVESQADLKFAYEDEINITTKLFGKYSFEKENLDKVLSEVSSRTPYTLSVIGNNIAVTLDFPVEKSQTKLSSIQQVVNGTVTDINGIPLPGVTVREEGTNTGVVTDFDGNFSIEVTSDDAVLVFTYIGMETIERTVGTNTSMNIQMEASSQSLNEVVLVGYSTQQKKDLTGSVAVVDVNTLQAQPAASALEALQGKAAGINIVNDGSPGSTPQIRIRGYSTINNNDPLYVIDGVPYQGNLSWLNQNDIQSMQVLKDASAASIYGSRANNGVIIVTTKKGREGSLRLTFDSYYGISAPVRSTFPELMTPQQYANYRYQSYRNAGLDPTSSLGIMYGFGDTPVLPEYLLAGNVVGLDVSEADADPANYNYDPSQFYQITRANQEGTDWMRAITREAPIQNYQFGATGGGENVTYAFSLGFLDQQGIIKHTSFKKYNIRSNIQISALEDNLRFGTNLQLSRTEGIGFATNPSNPGGYQNAYSPVGNVYKIQSIIPVYDIMGNFAGARGATLGDAKNPLAVLYRGRDNFTHDNRLFGNLFAEVDIIEGLVARTSFGVNLSHQNGQSIRYPAMEDAVSIATNSFGVTQGYIREWTWSNTLNYEKTFDEVHSLSLLTGVEAIRNNARFVSGSRDDYFILGDLDYYSLNTGSSNISNGEVVSRSALASLFSRVDYTFNNRYLLSATIRQDGSSNFGTENLYARFPAFSAGWRLSEENFFEDIIWVNDLKLRAGYGETGNQNIPGNNAYDLYNPGLRTSSYAISGNGLTSGVSQNQVGNPALSWEKVKSTNIGLDFTLLNYNLDGSVDVYEKNTEDMLYPVPLPTQAAGMASSPFRNVGNMRNKGIEVAINYHYNSPEVNGFNFDTGINFAKNENEIVYLAPGIENSTYGTGGSASGLNPTTIFQVGKPYGEFYGYRVGGIFQNEQEVAASTQPGARIGGFRYEDVNGNNSFSTEDRTTLGSPLPDFTYGLNFSASFRNFDLTGFFYGSEGNKIFNHTKMFTTFQPFPGAASTLLLDAWSPTNTESMIPSPYASASALEYQSSSYYIEDGSYFRLKNIQLGYTFKNIGNISSVRVYTSATNLFTITDYSGLDPEVSQFNSSFNLPGIDMGVYPSPQQFLFGINAKL